MPKSAPRLPLQFTALEAHRTLASVSRTAHALAGEDAQRRRIAVLCRQASQALGQAAAAAGGGARRWHGFIVNWGTGALGAAAVAWGLDWVGAWSWLTITAAIAAGTAAGYLAMRYWVRWRYRSGVKEVNACGLEARLRIGADMPAVVREARIALAEVKRAFKQRPDLAKSYVVWHPFRMTRAEDLLFEAWLNIARAEHACTDRDAFYRWMEIAPDGPASRDLARTILTAREALWPVLDDLRRRGSDRELAIAYAQLSDAWEILGKTIADLGLQLPVLDFKRFAGYALWMLPGLAVAAAVAVSTWPVLPVAAVSAAAFLALAVTDWAGPALRRRMAKPSDLAARLERLATLRYRQIPELQRTWAEAVSDRADALERIASDLVGDPDGTFDDEAFDAALARLPKWQRSSIVNLGLAAERMDAARGQIEAWTI